MKLDEISPGTEYATGGRWGTDRRRIRALGIDNLLPRLGRSKRMVRYEELDPETGAVIRTETTPDRFDPPQRDDYYNKSLSDDEFAAKLTAATERHAAYLREWTPSPLYVEAKDINMTWADYAVITAKRNAKDERYLTLVGALRSAVIEGGFDLPEHADVDVRRDGKLTISFSEDAAKGLLDDDGRALYDRVMLDYYPKGRGG